MKPIKHSLSRISPAGAVLILGGIGYMVFGICEIPKDYIAGDHLSAGADIFTMAAGATLISMGSRAYIFTSEELASPYVKPAVLSKRATAWLCYIAAVGTGLAARNSAYYSHYWDMARHAWEALTLFGFGAAQHVASREPIVQPVNRPSSSSPAPPN